jgi:UDP-galactopyranose mutase
VKRALIIGGGFAGCAAAHQLELLGGWDVTLLEAGPYLGAGVRTHWYGGHPYTFGPRHFLTKDERAVAYLHDIVPLRRCAEHEFVSYVEQDRAFYGYPIHEDDIGRMPEAGAIRDELAALAPSAAPTNFQEYWIGSIGTTLYRKFIDRYSRKMWMLDDNTEIDSFAWSPKGVNIKRGPRAAWDSAYSGYPLSPEGYDFYFDFATQYTTVHLNTAAQGYNTAAMKAKIAGRWYRFDIIINTVSPDIIGNGVYGKLDFIGRDLIKLVLPIEYALPPNVYFAYYVGDEPYTRVTEYKKFTRHKADTTLVTLEIPSRNNKLYPMPVKAQQDRAKQYFASFPDKVFSMGRAGSYTYAVDIDDCIIQAMDMARKLK